LSLWYRMINFTILVAGLSSFLPILISGMYGLCSLKRTTAFAWKCRHHWSNKIGLIDLHEDGSSAVFENFVFNQKWGDAKCPTFVALVHSPSHIHSQNSYLRYIFCSNRNINSLLYSFVVGYTRSIFILREIRKQWRVELLLLFAQTTCLSFLI
jgi:hypothetical protein